jgi:hypothetical protein
MLNPADDFQTATDLGLCVIEAEIERLPDDLGEFRDRAADVAERLKTKAENAPKTGEGQ